MPRPAGTAPARLPRPGTRARGSGGFALHPLAWWVWAGGAAVALMRVSTPAVLLSLVAGIVVTALVCRERPGAGSGVFARTLEASLVIGGVIILVRTGFHILLGFPDSSPVLFTLPTVDLPWFTNLHILGAVHVGGLTYAVVEGVRLAGLVIVFGAASAVSNPRRALRHLPSSLHHLGTAAVIAVAAAPGLVASVARVRRAQRLRAPVPGRRSRLRSAGQILIPVLSGALDQSLTLAGSMDSRGYARTHTRRGGVGAALVVALLAGAAGTYGLLDTTTPPGLSAGLLTGGSALAVGASVIAARSVRRTRYRATPWGPRETTVAGAGLLLALAAVVGTGPWAAAGGPAIALLVLAPILVARARPAAVSRAQSGIEDAASVPTSRPAPGLTHSPLASAVTARAHHARATSLRAEETPR